MTHPLATLYETTYQRLAFGPHWIGPAHMPHGERTPIARYEPTNPDGVGVTILCTAMPAPFYTLQPDTGPAMTTGSGQGQLARDIAQAMAHGMLGFETREAP